MQEAFTISLFEAIQQVHEEYHKTAGSTNQRLNFGAAILQDLEEDATNTALPKSYVNGYGPPRERRPTDESLSNGTNRNRVSVSHASQNETASAAVTDLEQRAQTDSYPS